MSHQFKPGDRIELLPEFRNRAQHGYTATVQGYSTARQSLGKLIVKRDAWQRSSVVISTQWRKVEGSK
jgi:hypothetical protein